MKTAFLAAIAAAVALAGGTVEGQAKPDLSGTWRPMKMEAGGQSQSITTTQQDLRIKQDAATFTLFHPPDGSSSTTYKLDGSPSPVADGMAQAAWVGSTIVISSTLGDNKIKTRDVFSLDASGSLVVEATAPPPVGSGSPTRVTYRKITSGAGATATAPEAISASAPPGFTLPAGFVVDERNSKSYDFGHEPMSYPARSGGGGGNIEPEGKMWSLRLAVSPPNKTADVTDAAMRAALKAQGWEIYTPSGTVVAHRIIDGKIVWFKGSASSGDFRLTIIEVGPPPHILTLAPPAALPETIADGADFPYLQRFPQSTFKRTMRRPGMSIDATAPGGAKEQLVGTSAIQKDYDLPANVSTYEFMVTYRDALTRAGWTVLRTAASSDALVVAHYAKNGRDLYAYLHGGTFLVADVGAENDAKRLADALAKEGHVAIYGIYFDVDQATLKPESETALQHVLDLLKADAALALEVQGHTDNTGVPAHNQTLSEARAASVRKWLVDLGIAGARLTPKGYGDTQPVGDNRTPDGRAKNRRVELKKS